MTYEGQEDKYQFTTSISGTYRFDTDLSSGGIVRVRIRGENGNHIQDSTYGLTIELEAGKTYILCVEYYDAPCDYTINIGRPNAMTDITGKTSVSGSLTYKDQEDKYQFTTSTNGTYRFDTDLSSGGKVRVKIKGENGTLIKSRTNELTIELEAGKTYILCVNYYDAPCDYEIFIGNS